jgi:hypothetical protein
MDQKIEKHSNVNARLLGVGLAIGYLLSGSAWESYRLVSASQNSTIECISKGSNLVSSTPDVTPQQSSGNTVTPNISTINTESALFNAGPSNNINSNHARKVTPNVTPQQSSVVANSSEITSETCTTIVDREKLTNYAGKIWSSSQINEISKYVITTKENKSLSLPQCADLLALRSTKKATSNVINTSV